MTEIIIKRGMYAGKVVENQPSTMIHPPRMGKKGIYVTIDGAPMGYMDRKVRVMLDNPNDVVVVGEPAPQPARKVKTDEEIINAMREKFQIVDGMTLAALQGNVRAMIVTGPPGVGKSYGIESVINSLDAMVKMELIDTKSINLDAPKGMEKVAAASPLGLYQLLYAYSRPGSLLVLDDSDSLLYDETALNMLKAVTDSGKRRRLTWRTESRVLEEAGVPFEFDFEGAIIFITNLDFENSRGKIGEHLKAIVSRCHYIDVGIHNVREKLLRCRQIVRDGMLERYDFSDVVRNDILDYMEANKDRLREISLRMVTKLADLAVMDHTGWRRYADHTCLKSA